MLRKVRGLRRWARVSNVVYTNETTWLRGSNHVRTATLCHTLSSGLLSIRSVNAAIRTYNSNATCYPENTPVFNQLIEPLMKFKRAICWNIQLAQCAPRLISRSKRNRKSPALIQTVPNSCVWVFFWESNIYSKLKDESRLAKRSRILIKKNQLESKDWNSLDNFLKD